MIYFDNASTGGFKPYSVIDASLNVMRYLCANPNRSGHRLSLTGLQIVQDTRSAFAKHFSCSSDRVIFTKNCTEALNIAILGSVKKGGHVITTIFEHNSVLRPLNALKNKGLISLDVVSPTDTLDIVSAISQKINDKTYMIVCTSVSNVNGYELPLERIGELAKKHNLFFLIDGAQGGGHIPLDMKKQHTTMLALAGHKGLYGIMGSGVLLIQDGVTLEPLTYGGTGTESFNLNQPDCYPERLESGTLNLPAIASLKEGLSYVVKNRQTFAPLLYSMSEHLIEGLKNISGVKTYSAPNQSGIVAFSVKNLPSGSVCDALNTDFDIAVRGGLHCAPLMHEFLSTKETGLVRASLCAQNTTREISVFIGAISKIAKSNN